MLLSVFTNGFKVINENSRVYRHSFISTIPSHVERICFEDFFAPTVVDDEIEAGDEISMDKHLVVVAVTIWCKGIGDVDHGRTANEIVYADFN